MNQGYVVITLGSLYETDYTVMPDGQVIHMAEELDNMDSISEET